MIMKELNIRKGGERRAEMTQEERQQERETDATKPSSWIIRTYTVRYCIPEVSTSSPTGWRGTCLLVE